MSQLSIDARIILTHLNDLGYRNITAEQLKDFMKDLRKLIKYEERLGTGNGNENIPTIDEKSKNLFEKLYKTTTASYRAKLPENVIHYPAKNISSHKVLNHKQKRSSNKLCNSNAKQKSSDTEKCKINNKNMKTDGQNIDSCRSSKVITPSDRPSSSKMWIRPKSVQSQKTTGKQNGPKNSGPVELYQYYKAEWDKFKPNLPGENAHSDLRWEIRKKLLE